MSAVDTEATPWLARDEWRRGRIPSSQKSGLVLPWIATVCSCGVTGAYLAVHGVFRDPHAVVDDPSILVLTPFVIVALVFLVRTLRRTWLAIRSGPSTLELSTIPGIIGGELRGTIRLGRPLRSGQSVRVTLSCHVMSWTEVRSESRGHGSVPWQDDREIAASVIAGGGNVVPVHFTIPADAPATVKHEQDEPDRWHSVWWSLEASGEPGEFWRGEYEVPVFRTSQSPAPSAPLERSAGAIRMEVGKLFRGTASRDTSAELVQRPASTRIETQTTARGLEITLPVRPAFIMESLWVLATLPLWVAPLLIARWLPGVPFGMMFGASLAAAFFLNVLPMFFLVLPEPRRIVVGRREIVVICGWPGLGRNRRFPIDQYDGVEGDPQAFSILRKNGSFFNRHFFLTQKLESKAEARWLAAEIERVVAPSAPAAEGQPP